MAGRSEPRRAGNDAREGGGVVAVEHAVAVVVALGDAEGDAVGGVAGPFLRIAGRVGDADDVAPPVLAVVAAFLQRAVGGGGPAGVGIFVAANHAINVA